MDDLLVVEYKGKCVTDSREVAKAIGKTHDQLMRSIRTYIEHLESAILQSPTGQVKIKPSEFFIKSSYLNRQNKKQPCYLITRKGCDMVANKMTGAKGTIFTALYINRFYEMEEALKSRQSARMDFPQFTDAIKRIHENPAPHHFTNECNLINRLVIGMDAKKFKEINNIPTSEKSIRPYLPPQQMKLVDALQKADIGLMISERNFSKRKMMLEWYMSSLQRTGLLA